MRLLTAWGGYTYPILRWVKSSAEESYTIRSTEGVPLPKLDVFCDQDAKELARMASGNMRRRGSGWRMRFKLTAARSGNRDFMAWVVGALDAYHVYIRPHPDMLYWPSVHGTGRDEWEVVLQDDLDLRYWLDHWIGHDIELNMTAVESMRGMPQDASYLGFCPVRYETEGGAPVPTDDTGYVYPGEKMLPMCDGPCESANETAVAYVES